MKEWKIVIFDAIKNTALKNEDIVAERNRIYYVFKNLYKIIEEYQNTILEILYFQSTILKKKSFYYGL